MVLCISVTKGFLDAFFAVALWELFSSKNCIVGGLSASDVKWKGSSVKNRYLFKMESQEDLQANLDTYKAQLKQVLLDFKFLNY